MTVRDYENWLLMHRNEPENLTRHNRKNLHKVLKGEQLRARNIPKNSDNVTYPPNGETRFNQKYSGHMIELPNSETGGTVEASNYIEYDHYMPPKSLKHLAHINPDENDKQDSQFLNCIRPKVSLK